MKSLNKVIIPFLLAFALAVPAGFAQADPPAAEENQASVPVYATEISGQPPSQVVGEILGEKPDAVVLVPADEAQKTITAQDADTLNTVLIVAEFGYQNTIYMVSPHYTWLQSISMLGFNSVLLKELDLKLGRWTRIMQKGGRALRLGATKLNLVTQEKWQARTELIGNFLTHGALTYAYYSLLQIAAEMPDLSAGAFSAEAQTNALRKAGSGFLSGFGWTMLARRWDAMPDEERPITRQAYTAFNQIRGMILGIFIPLLITTPNNISVSEFLIRNSPFYISAATGTVFYFWGDPILRRFPQIGRGLERFETFTQRLNAKMTTLKTKICARILRRAD